MPKQVVVNQLPRCDYCQEPARYDFSSKFGGSWAFGCEAHWLAYGRSNKLGTGIGQRLVSEAEVEAGIEVGRIPDDMEFPQE
jgi:hypothetical protein